MVDDRPKAAEFLQHERFFLLENTCCDPAATHKRRFALHVAMAELGLQRTVRMILIVTRVQQSFVLAVCVYWTIFKLST